MQIAKDMSVFRMWFTFPVGFPFPPQLINTSLSRTLNLIGDWHFLHTAISGTGAAGVQGDIWDHLIVSVGVIDRTPTPGATDGSSGVGNLVGNQKQIVVQVFNVDPGGVEAPAYVLSAPLKVLIEGRRYMSEDNVMDAGDILTL